MNNEEQTDDAHFLRKFISLGDVIGLLASLAVFSFGYGSLSSRVEDLQGDVAALAGRDITPGAANRIAVLEARMMQTDQTLEQQRDDAADFRREVRDSLARIEAKLDDHSRAGR